MSRRRRPTSQAARVPPTDDDDLMAEILLRLPPRPSSLPRASLVCKRWRRLVTDPQFLRRFRARHRKPPLLGLFFMRGHEISFSPTLDPPDCIPAARFSLRIDGCDCDGGMCGCMIIGCRHGLVLLLDDKWTAKREPQRLLVWDPVDGDLLTVPVPPSFHSSSIITNGAVLCPNSDSSMFQVVVIGRTIGTGCIGAACVYSSETGMWGELISALSEPRGIVIRISYPSTLVGNSLHWLLIEICMEGGFGFGILKLDLDRPSLSVILVPLDVCEYCPHFSVMPAEGGGLGLIVVSGFSAKLWKMETEYDRAARWVLQRTIELDKLDTLRPALGTWARVVGFAEDDNVVLLSTSTGFLMVHLESMQFKELCTSSLLRETHFYCCPFTSLYTAGI